MKIRHDRFTTVLFATLTLLLAPRARAQDVGFGNALAFNGTNQFVRVPQPFLPTNGDFTIECWVNATIATGSFREIVSQGPAANGPRFYLGIDPSGNFRAGDNWIAPGVALPSNSWHHVALARTATDAFLYLDGVLRAAKGSVLSNAYTAAFADIGQQFQSGGEFWLGGIDDVRVWNRARAQGEIKATMNHALAGNESNLVAYYRLDASSGTVATNSATATGAALNGSLSNAPVWIASGAPFAFFADGTTNVLNGVTNTTTGDVYVGSNAPNTTLILTNGGSLSDTNGIIGGTGGSTNNFVLVTGAGSMWSNSGTLQVGAAFANNNRLVVSNGGRVVSATGQVGAQSDNNSALVTGAGSVWSNSGTIFVGSAGGTGNQLTVANGGEVDAGSELDVGYNPGVSNNVLLVTGAGSVVRTPTLESGVFGMGNRIVVSNGGAIFSGFSAIGESADNNLGLVTGAGSVWSNAGDLLVGWGNSTNQLTVSNQGTVINNGALVLGNNATSSNNLLNVAGGSVFATNGGGTAVLDVRRGNVLFNGGAITADQLVLTNGAASVFTFNGGTLVTRTATISNGQDFVVGLNGGSGPALWDVRSNAAPTTVAGLVMIGSNTALNTLLITNGGRLTSTIGHLGFGASAMSNQAIVSGPGSAWNNSGNLTVGNLGSGNRLLITNGGAVVNSNAIIGGSGGASNNQVTVTGPGSAWTNRGDLIVGNDGALNTLLISNGASVKVAGNSTLGAASGGGNRAIVSGAGSIWQMNGYLSVGDYSPGNSVLITNGAVTQTDQGYVGFSSALNQVTVTGSNSLWNSGPLLFVGYYGSSNSLLITNGGTVRAGNLAAVGYQPGYSNNSLTVANGTLTVTNGGASAVLNVIRGGAVFTGGNITADQLVLTNSVTNVDGGGTFSFNYGTLITRSATLGNGQDFVVGRDAGGGVATWDVRSNAAATTVAQGLDIGSTNAANATLLVTNGATLSVGAATYNGSISSRLGVTDSSSNNLAVIAGSNSVWTNSGSLRVGQSGSFNMLLISNGGVVVDSFGSIGASGDGNSNQVIVTGPGSLWSNKGGLFIGESGVGNVLLITNGGTVRAANAYVGFTSGSNGLLNVGNGTLIATNSGSTGVLDVRRGSVVFNGGAITADRLLLANPVTNVDGGGTFTFNAGTLVTRTATISNGQDFVVGANTGFGSAIWDVRSNATPTTVANNLIIGSGAGNATLWLTNGGTLTDVIARIGFGGTGTNLALVTGAGSTWSSSGRLDVGSSGGSINQLIVGNGGLVANSTAIIGNNPGADSNGVLVTGAGSRWTNASFLVVGNNNASGNQLVISNGGSAFNTLTKLGSFSTSSNNLVLVTGAGSLLTINGDLQVGENGSYNTVLITNGGAVQAANAYVGFNAGASNNVLRFANGALTVSGGLTVNSNNTLTGSGIINGSVTSGGTIAPGNSAGTLAINGSLSLQSSSMMSFEIGGLIATNQYDQVTVTNFVQFAGTLSLSLLNNFYPVPTNSFTLMTFASSAGFFANAANGAVLQTTDGLRKFTVVYTPTSLILTNAQQGSAFALTSILPAATNVTVRFLFSPTNTYEVQYNTNLGTTNWIVATNASARFTTNAPGILQWIDTGLGTGGQPLPAARFYRVRQLP